MASNAFKQENRTEQNDRVEAFRRATGATVRAISEHPELQINFSVEPDSLVSPQKGDQVKLPVVSKALNDTERTLLRGHADTAALRLRHHDQAIHHKLLPSNPDARAVYEALEKTRIEAIGATEMPGVGINLTAVLEERCQKRGYAQITDRRQAPLPEAMGLLLREALTGAPPPEAAQSMVELWRPWIEAKIGRKLFAMDKDLYDQDRFSRMVRDLLADMALEDAPDQEKNPEETEDNSESQGQDDSAPDQAEDEIPQENTPEMGSMGEAEAGAEEDMQALGGDQHIDDEGDQRGEGETDETEEPGATQPPHPDFSKADDPLRYKAFSTDFDEIALAEDLCDADELIRLRNQLDKQLAALHGVIGRLANRLQRLLMAKQFRGWDFDLEEGILDTARLARVIVDPMVPLSFKQEQEAPFRDTVVSLLIDNSGSMRGRPITVAAMSADILARTLERCGVKVEILGFTTKEWKGGRSRRAWLEQNKPAHPGRLNDLRHIIYKPADMPWRRGKRHLGLMLKDGILKENIDGEALQWAHDRLSARAEQRRILMVISDGAPVDDSTSNANPAIFLERHLRKVIADIEERSSVQLLAIGIGHDVTRYYRNAVTIMDAEQLGGTMMERLADLFDEDERASSKRAFAHRLSR